MFHFFAPRPAGFWDQLIKYELELFGTNSVEIETTDDGM